MIRFINFLIKVLVDLREKLKNEPMKGKMTAKEWAKQYKKYDDKSYK